MLIWSRSPPPPPHMNESFIKTVSGLCLAPSLDNINELSFQMQFMIHINCQDLIGGWTLPVWIKIWSGIFLWTGCRGRDECCHELVGQFILSINNQCKPQRFPGSEYSCSQVTGGEFIVWTRWRSSRVSAPQPRGSAIVCMKIIQLIYDSHFALWHWKTQTSMQALQLIHSVTTSQ